MTVSVEIDNVPALKLAVARANEICIVPRFGCSEKWVTISRKEAKALIAALKPSDTPQDAEMYSSHFASFVRQVNGYTVLFLG